MDVIGCMVGKVCALMGVWSLWHGLIPRKLGLSVLLWCFLFCCWIGEWVGWWVGWWMYGFDWRMHGWLGVCVDGVWSLWRGFISHKLGSSVVLFCC